MGEWTQEEPAVNYQSKKSNLNEGLRFGDLKGFVDQTFLIDQFKSKMGKDEDVVVISFKVKDKFPAIDLMEFIEKGYTFVLDADMSSGEERDGTYSVFVELERSKDVPEQIHNIVTGVSKLCDCKDWRFRYYKDISSLECTVDNLTAKVPLTAAAYEDKLREIKKGKVSTFLDKGATDEVELDLEDNLTISKPYAESLNLKLIAIGDYSVLRENLTGAVKLDSASMGQTIYLNKYLGNYAVEKVGNKFVIVNGDQAMVVTKKDWQ